MMQEADVYRLLISSFILLYKLLAVEVWGLQRCEVKHLLLGPHLRQTLGIDRKKRSIGGQKGLIRLYDPRMLLLS